MVMKVFLWLPGYTYGFPVVLTASRLCLWLPLHAWTISIASRLFLWLPGYSPSRLVNMSPSSILRERLHDDRSLPRTGPCTIWRLLWSMASGELHLPSSLIRRRSSTQWSHEPFEGCAEMEWVPHAGPPGGAFGGAPYGATNRVRGVP